MATQGLVGWPSPDTAACVALPGTAGSAVYGEVGHLRCGWARTMPVDLQRLAHDIACDRCCDLGTTLSVLGHDRDGVSGLAVGRKADEQGVIALELGNLQLLRRSAPRARSAAVIRRTCEVPVLPPISTPGSSSAACRALPRQPCTTSRACHAAPPRARLVRAPAALAWVSRSA
jgi:hypothetical protein